MKHIQKKTGNAIRKERLFLKKKNKTKQNKYLMLLFLKKTKTKNKQTKNPKKTNKKKQKKKKRKKERKSQGPINSLTSAVFSFTLPVFMLLEHF